MEDTWKTNVASMFEDVTKDQVLVSYPSGRRARSLQASTFTVKTTIVDLTSNSVVGVEKKIKAALTDKSIQTTLLVGSTSAFIISTVDVATLAVGATEVLAPPPSPPSATAVSQPIVDSSASQEVKKGDELAGWVVGVIVTAVVVCGIVTAALSYRLCKKTKANVQMSAPMPVSVMVGKDEAALSSTTADADPVQVELEQKA